MSHITQFEHLKLKLEAIKLATNNFANEKLIGKGGFGKVYMGEIVHSKGQTMVALKRLDRKFGQGDREFWKEIMMLSLYKHKNIVSLLGYCDDVGEKILVYEYACRKSLDLYLNNDKLTWVRRLKICIGAARGLAYLHTPGETQLRVLHRDVKSANILLDENWNSKISDFGLSKFGPANQQFTFLISEAAGTHGYCDPLYEETGLLTKESDVYSFGVVLFEVLCGRLCFSSKNGERRPLKGLVRECYEGKRISEIIYGNMKDEINPDSLKVFVEIAYQCLKRERKERPLMTEIMVALERALRYQEEADGRVHRDGILNVKVRRAMGVKRSINPFAANNPYLILNIENANPLFNMKIKTSVKHHEVNPEWNEEFTLYVENIDDQDLQICVHNMISAEKHDFVGNTLMALNDLIPEFPKTSDLEVMDANYLCIFILMVEVVFKPFVYDQIPTNIEDVSPMHKPPTGTPMGGGLLVVIIHQALLHHENNDVHASVSLLFRDELRNTPSMMNTRFPVWEQELTFMLEEPPTNEEELHLEVFSNSWKRLTHRKKSLGCVDINLRYVVRKKRDIGTYIVRSSEFVNNDENRLYVELQWITFD